MDPNKNSIELGQSDRTNTGDHLPLLGEKENPGEKSASGISEQEFERVRNLTFWEKFRSDT